ncbi:MAG: LysR family transcriptional regulator [Alphaproteobacteria bacterium]|nr:LysR family transcriptional regulator [Alphaproteobacteria bacterium]
MKPSLDAITTFIAIVEGGGVSPAARRLGIAKSVVSKRLAELESVAGAELIRRSSRASQPTDVGEAFYLRAKRIVAELDAALEESAADKGPLRGPIRVAAPLTFSRLYLSDLFIRFAADHPGVLLTLDCDDRRVDIRSGGYDLAIRIGRLSDSALIARKICTAALVLVASPEYVASTGEPKSIEELSQHKVLAYGNSAMPHQWRFDAGGEPVRSITVEPRLTVNSTDVMLDAARAGLGVARLPLFCVAEALARGELVRLLPMLSLESGPISAVWLPDRPPSRRLRTLIELLAESIPQRLREIGALTD